jgi:predicted metal-dependent hydrolase
VVARVVETPAAASLPGGRVDYTLRRNPRSRTLRVTIDPRRGLVVSIPPATRRGWARPESRVDAFLGERERWIRRHLARLEQERAEHAARGGLNDGATIRYRGESHRLVIGPAAPSAHRSTVAREGLDEGDALVVRLASRDRRGVASILEDWLRARANEAVGRAVALHAEPLRARPERVSLRDPRTRWGSASREGALSFSWRLVLAPPEALETVVVHELAHLRIFGHGPRFWALVASRRPDHLEWRRWLRRHSHELHRALDD